MTEKWNDRCKCDCPREAHEVQLSGHSTLLMVACKGSVNWSGGFYPCKCNFVTPQKIESMACETCGYFVTLPEPIEIPFDKDEGRAFTDSLSKGISDQCQFARTGRHGVNARGE